MTITAGVLSGFAVALAAPFLHRVGRGWTGWILAAFPLALAFYFATYVPRVAAGEVVTVTYGWLPALEANLDINLSFYIDGLGLLFALLITVIGALIVLYASSYLNGHPHLGRFYAIILMFMASMLGLVLSGNLISLFVFWELTSITSYLLIGFDHEDEQSRTSALQALLVTAGGGLALLAGFVMLGIVGGSLELADLLGRGDLIRGSALYPAIAALVFVGAFTKSAQVPFHFWLPNAMAAPTPVSAYLHSATMVKAGVYLLARFSPMMGGTDVWHYTIGIAGAVTMVVGGYMALRHNDLKRILAYSTVSALGALVLMLGIGTDLAVKAAVVFLLAHALYKAALFLVAGAIDHEAGTRMIDGLRGLRKAMPVTAGVSWIAAASMAGFPLFIGFVSKEKLIEAVLEGIHEAAPGAVFFTAATVAQGALFVAIAMMVAVRPFVGKEVHAPKHPHEAPLKLLLGPAMLAAVGLVLGLIPGLTIIPLLAAATSSILGKIADLEIVIWAGFNLVLALTVVAVAAGAATYGLRDLIVRAARRVDASQRWGPESAYNLGFNGLMKLAEVQTRIWQNGYLRYYLLMTLALTVGLVWTTLLTREVIFWSNDWRDVRPYEAGVAGLVLGAAVIAAVMRPRLAAVIALGTVGYGVALIFVLFGAPDLAMTQFLVETLAVILFVLVFYHMPSARHPSKKASRLRDGVIALAAGALMTALVLVAVNIQLAPSISDYYVTNSVPLARGGNVVNVILVDFRALDTLGEITVLGVAAVGIYALLKIRAANKGGR